MILPIVAYGNPILRKKAKEINKDSVGVEDLIKNMFETMYNAHGVGLAAPQVGESVRLFIVDASNFAQDEEYIAEAEDLKKFIRIFINPEIVMEEGVDWKFSEGCLSIPDIREDVYRKPTIELRYFDQDWVEHQEKFEGIRARIIQHEYDHIEGILFTDKLSAFKKRLLKNKLNNISHGRINVEYKMKFINK